MATTALAPKTTTRKKSITIPKSKPSKKAVPVKKSATPKVRKANARPGAVTLSYAQFERLSVVNQIRRAFMPGARMAAIVGLVIGGFVPVASWSLVHMEVANYPYLWVLVVGGLAYSAITVFKWARAAFGDPVKAGGFCILLEGILTLSHLHILSYTALGILIFINAVSSACSLQVRKEEVA